MIKNNNLTIQQFNNLFVKRHLGLIIALTLFILQASLIPQSGMTWDEPSSFFFGRANLKFWLTGNRAYLTDLKNPVLFADSPFKYIYGEDVYPPVPFVIASATSLVLAENLKLISVIDAHHLGEVAIGSVGVYFFFLLATQAGLSSRIAAVTTLLYALYPTIFGQMRSDAKDIPLMSFLVISAYWFLRSRRELKLLPAAFFAISFGLALGTKPTAVLLAVVIGLFTVFDRPKRIFYLIFIFAVGGLVAYLSWPWLWDDPVGKLTTIWSFFKSVGYGMPVLYLGKQYAAGVNVPLSYPYAILLFQTPPIVFLLFLIGFVVRKRGIQLFFLLWFAITMGRFLLPGVLIYARVRHFIDAMPAFFILVGFGLTRLSRRWFFVAGSLVIASELLIIITHFPFEPGYYNIFVGGTKTIAQKELFDADYWGSGVKQAMEYIQKTAVGETGVYTCGLLHLAIFYESTRVKAVADGNQAQYVILPNSPSFFGGAINFHKSYDTLVYTVERAGAPMFYVFKRQSPTYWHCGNETDTAEIILDNPGV